MKKIGFEISAVVLAVAVCCGLSWGQAIGFNQGQSMNPQEVLSAAKAHAMKSAVAAQAVPVGWWDDLKDWWNGSEEVNLNDFSIVVRGSCVPKGDSKLSFFVSCTVHVKGTLEGVSIGDHRRFRAFVEGNVPVKGTESSLYTVGPDGESRVPIKGLVIYLDQNGKAISRAILTGSVGIDGPVDVTGCTSTPGKYECLSGEANMHLAGSTEDPGEFKSAPEAAP